MGLPYYYYGSKFKDESCYFSILARLQKKSPPTLLLFLSQKRTHTRFRAIGTNHSSKQLAQRFLVCFPYYLRSTRSILPQTTSGRAGYEVEIFFFFGTQSRHDLRHLIYFWALFLFEAFIYFLLILATSHLLLRHTLHTLTVNSSSFHIF
jgi:hypothetical protein